MDAGNVQACPSNGVAAAAAAAPAAQAAGPANPAQPNPIPIPPPPPMMWPEMGLAGEQNFPPLFVSWPGKLSKYKGFQEMDPADWLRDYEFTADANGWTDALKKQKFPFVMTESARNWFTMDVYPKYPQMTWSEIKEAFLRYYLPVNHETYYLAKIKKIKKERAQFDSILTYMTDLKYYLNLYSGGQMSEAMMIDHIKEGMDPRMARKLMLAQPRGMDEFIRKACLIHLSMADSDQEREKNPRNTDLQKEIDSLRRQLENLRRPGPILRPFYSRTDTGQPRCWNCNRVGHVAASCPDLGPNRGPPYAGQPALPAPQRPPDPQPSASVRPKQVRFGPARSPSPSSPRRTASPIRNTARVQALRDESPARHLEYLHSYYEDEPVQDDRYKGEASGYEPEPELQQYGYRDPPRHNPPATPLELEDHDEYRAQFPYEINNNVTLQSKRPAPATGKIYCKHKKDPRLMYIPLIASARNFGSVPVATVGMVDTGSTVTIIDRTLFKTGRFVLDPCPDLSLIGAAGHPINLLGTTSIQLQHDSKNGGPSPPVVPIKALVCEDIISPVILGFDFARASRLLIDCEKKTCDSPTVTPTRPESEEKPKQGAVRTVKPDRIPPFSSKFVPVQAKLKYLHPDCDFLVTAALRIAKAKKVYAPNGIYSATNKPFEILISNLSDQPLDLLADEIVANVTALEEDIVLNPEGRYEKLCPVARKLNLSFGETNIGANLGSTEVTRMRGLLERNRLAFAQDEGDIGQANGVVHAIQLEDPTPINTNPYRKSPFERAKISEQVRKMLALGVIDESQSPWSSPVVIVRKKDGSSRFCVDFRKVNAKTKKDVYPLPRTDDALSYLRGSRYFSVLDLLSGYWQIRMSDESKEVTAFSTCDGHYEFNVMPFGLCNSPATFQRFMDVTLAQLKWNSCLVYLDDIIIFGADFNQHQERLQAVFECLKLAGLKLKPSKCIFGTDTVRFLGHVVNTEGIAPDPDKVKAIAAFPRPQRVVDLQCFLGMASYYRKFIETFAVKAAGLHKLLKKDVPFEWGRDQEDSFNAIKGAMLAAPVLVHYDPEKDQEIRVDASGEGLGALLLQREKDGMHLVECASRSLSKEEKNYSVTEQECLAVVFATSKFRPYIAGKKVRVTTDHNALVWLMKKQQLPPRLARWVLTLQEFDLDYNYKKGKLNQDADALSRNPVDEPEMVNALEDRAAVPITAPTCFTVENLRKAQTTDPFCQGIRNELDNNPDAHEKFIDLEQILYHQADTTLGPRLVPVVPEALQAAVLSGCHDDKVAGHLGVEKTYARIRDRYFWPDLKKAVKSYVQSCMDCQTRNYVPQKPCGLLQPIKVGGMFERVGIDLVGPFKKTHNGNRYIIIATDYLSKWVEADAIPASTALDVAEFFVNRIVLRHGAPTILQSDQGRSFLSNLVKDTLHLLGVEHRTSSPYHPQTNGLTERVNGIVINMLSKFVDKDQKNWDQLLPYVVFAYNTSKHSSTGYCPFFLLHGRRPILPGELPATEGIEDPSQYATEVHDNLIQARHFAAQEIARTQEKTKLYADRKRREVHYQPDDLVLVYTPVRTKGQSSKLLHRYFGPKKVIEKVGPVTYLLESVQNSKTKREAVHVSRMKPYRARVRTVTPIPHIHSPSSSEDPSSTTDSEIEDVEIGYYPGPRTSTPITEPAPPLDPPVDMSTPAPIRPPKRRKAPKIYKKAKDIFKKHLVNHVQVVQRLPEPQPRSPRLYPSLVIPQIVLYFMAQSVHSTFVARSPTVWKPDKKPVVEGQYNFGIQIHYSHACNTFKGKNSKIGRAIFLSLYDWCITTFTNEFLKEIELWCPRRQGKPPADTHKPKTRRKRFIFALISIGAIVVTGVMAGAVISHEVQVSKVKENQRFLVDQMEAQEKLAARLRERQDKFEAKLAHIERELRELLYRVNALEDLFPLAMSMVADLRVQMSRDKVLLKKIRKAWAKKIVDPAIAEFINYTLPCEPDCEYPLAQAVDCGWYPHENIIYVRIDIPMISSNITVARADSFKLVKQNQTHRCLVKYSGPERIAIRGNCINPLFGGLFDEESDRYIMPTFFQCIKNSTLYSTDHWKETNCDIGNIDTRTLVQYKTVGRLLYVYCFLNEIVLYNVTRACPDLVFSIPNNEVFRIGDREFQVTKLTIKTEISFRGTLTDRINHRFAFDPVQFYSRLNTQTLRSISAPKSLPYPKIENTPILSSFLSPWKSSLITLGVCLALVFCGCYCYKRHGKVAAAPAPATGPVVSTNFIQPAVSPTPSRPPEVMSPRQLPSAPPAPPNYEGKILPFGPFA